MNKSALDDWKRAGYDVSGWEKESKQIQAMRSHSRPPAHSVTKVLFKAVGLGTMHVSSGPIRVKASHRAKAHTRKARR